MSTNLVIKQNWGTQFGISAYSEKDAQIKDSFIRDARKYLNAVAKILKTTGIKATEVSVNKGGVAVSGDIMLEASTERGETIFITIGSGLYGRSTADHIGIMWRVCDKGSSTANKGDNNWPSPDTTYGDLSQMILEALSQVSFFQTNHKGENMNIQTQPIIQYPTPIIPRMTEYKYTLVVSYDNDPENPREWDNLGTFVSFDRNTSAADETHNDPRQVLIELVDQCVLGFEQHLLEKDEVPSLSTLMELAEDHYVIMPVCKYEHGGVAYSTSSYSCPWDSGQIGFIYVAKDTLREQYGWNRITSKRMKQVKAWLSAEIETFSNWANGTVYGFTLYYHDAEVGYTEGDEQESCGGFYYTWAPETLWELMECGIAEHLPQACLNDDLTIVFKHG